MGHGFMGLRLSGLAYLVGAASFFAYLGSGALSDLQPKYEVDAEIAYLAKETQPGIVPEYYIKKKKNN